MPKGRMLNKKISNDEKVAKLSLKATLFYTWCIPNLDFEGRLLADVWSLKSIFPFISEISPRNIPYLIKELVSANLVIYYGNDKHKYMQFKGFKNNQSLKEGREAKSEIPAPNQELILSDVRETPPKDKISKVKIRENKSKQANAGVNPELKKVYDKGLNVYQLLNQFKKQLSIDYEISDSVLMNVCKAYLNNKTPIRNNWAWFLKVLNTEVIKDFENQKIKESDEAKKVIKELEGLINQTLEKMGKR